MDLLKAISSSSALQIVQYLQTHGEATTKQISEALPDIPAPTLYRHINKLITDEVFRLILIRNIPINLHWKLF